MDGMHKFIALLRLKAFALVYSPARWPVAVNLVATTRSLDSSIMEE